MPLGVIEEKDRLVDRASVVMAPGRVEIREARWPRYVLFGVVAAFLGSLWLFLWWMMEGLDATGHAMVAALLGIPLLISALVILPWQCRMTVTRGSVGPKAVFRKHWFMFTWAEKTHSLEGDRIALGTCTIGEHKERNESSAAWNLLGFAGIIGGIIGAIGSATTSSREVTVLTHRRPGLILIHKKTNRTTDLIGLKTAALATEAFRAIRATFPDVVSDTDDHMSPEFHQPTVGSDQG